MAVVGRGEPGQFRNSWPDLRVRLDIHVDIADLKNGTSALWIHGQLDGNDAGKWFARFGIDHLDPATIH
jgi:hypothetical protein